MDSQNEIAQGIKLGLDGWYLIEQPDIIIRKNDVRPVANPNYKGPIYAVEKEPLEIEIRLVLRRGHHGPLQVPM